jgi:CheY-like chemotaxis protein
MTKILVVEDSRFLRLAMERALSRAGYDVITAADGEDAVKKARANLPALILLDLLLPKLTGTDVLKALKKDPATAGIAVVVLTAMSQKNEDWLLRDGAFAFLAKSELALEKGSGTLLAAVADILRKLHLEVPGGARGSGVKG